MERPTGRPTGKEDRFRVKAIIIKNSDYVNKIFEKITIICEMDSINGMRLTQTRLHSKNFVVFVEERQADVDGEAAHHVPMFDAEFVFDARVYNPSDFRFSGLSSRMRHSAMRPFSTLAVQSAGPSSTRFEHVEKPMT